MCLTIMRVGAERVNEKCDFKWKREAQKKKIISSYLTLDRNGNQALKSPLREILKKA